jgi:ParB family chromosome partitioning protein
MLSSESAEWYTPAAIVDAAREVMGSIELDPASCAEANATVRATRIYTRADDGLRQTWNASTLWLNMPYGKDETDNVSNQARWSHKLISSHCAGTVGQGCMLVNAVPGNRWFRPLWAFPICFLDGRVHFVPPSGSGPRNSPTHSSCVVYLGPRVDRFAEVFGRLGTVVLPLQIVRARAAQGGLGL